MSTENQTGNARERTTRDSQRGKTLDPLEVVLKWMNTKEYKNFRELSAIKHQTMQRLHIQHLQLANDVLPRLGLVQHLLEAHDEALSIVNDRQFSSGSAIPLPTHLKDVQVFLDVKEHLEISVQCLRGTITECEERIRKDEKFYSLLSRSQELHILLAIGRTFPFPNSKIKNSPIPESLRTLPSEKVTLDELSEDVTSSLNYARARHALMRDHYSQQNS
jgi:hypothetical protein